MEQPNIEKFSRKLLSLDKERDLIARIAEIDKKLEKVGYHYALPGEKFSPEIIETARMRDRMIKELVESGNFADENEIEQTAVELEYGAPFKEFVRRLKGWMSHPDAEGDYCLQCWPKYLEKVEKKYREDWEREPSQNWIPEKNDGIRFKRLSSCVR